MRTKFKKWTLRLKLNLVFSFHIFHHTRNPAHTELTRRRSAPPWRSSVTQRWSLHTGVRSWSADWPARGTDPVWTRCPRRYERWTEAASHILTTCLRQQTLVIDNVTTFTLCSNIWPLGGSRAAIFSDIIWNNKKTNQSRLKKPHRSRGRWMWFLLRSLTAASQNLELSRRVWSHEASNSVECVLDSMEDDSSYTENLKSVSEFSVKIKKSDNSAFQTRIFQMWVSKNYSHMALIVFHITNPTEGKHVCISYRKCSTCRRPSSFQSS